MRKNSFVGTEQYVSPEVLLDNSHGSPVDLWALGVIVFQLFTGYTPFKGIN
jgi:serine/threonine protein kinase